MNEVPTIKYNTGFPANINNYRTTADDFRNYDGTSDKLSAIEIIKNEFFIIQEPKELTEITVQSLFSK